MRLLATVEKDFVRPGQPSGKYRPKLRHSLEGGPSYGGRTCGSVAEAQRDIEAFLGRRLEWSQTSAPGISRPTAKLQDAQRERLDGIPEHTRSYAIMDI